MLWRPIWSDCRPRGHPSSRLTARAICSTFTGSATVVKPTDGLGQRPERAPVGAGRSPFVVRVSPFPSLTVVEGNVYLIKASRHRRVHRINQADMPMHSGTKRITQHHDGNSAARKILLVPDILVRRQQNIETCFFSRRQQRAALGKWIVCPTLGQSPPQLHGHAANGRRFAECHGQRE